MERTPFLPPDRLEAVLLTEDEQAGLESARSKATYASRRQSQNDRRAIFEER